MEREPSSHSQMKPKNSQVQENKSCGGSSKTCVQMGRPTKRRKSQMKENKHWTVANSAVEPGLLADMGVGKLIENNIYTDDSDGEATTTTSPVLVENSSNLEYPPANPLNLLTPENSQEVSKPNLASPDLPMDSDFFIFRRLNKIQPPTEDPFTRLSDEMILLIFSYLPKNTLVRNALVCKRWQRVSYDETLWVRLDLSSRMLCSNAMSHILSRGTSVLRLAQTEFEEPVFAEDFDDVTYKLQFLDLSMAVISESGLATLLGACTHLRKLSLEHCRVNAAVCASIGLNTKLEVLNLSMSQGLDHDGLVSITTGCKSLTALNVGWTRLDCRALSKLCLTLNSRLQRLNLAGCRKTLRDFDIQSLIESCPMLVELDASDCVALSAVSVTALLELSRLEHLALSRCYAITPAILKRFARMESLHYLDVFNLMPDGTLMALQTALPTIKLNVFVCSSIARPTVGIRRTSIWGLRVRD